jgi:hypothetical protein
MKQKMTIKQARKIARGLLGGADGWTSSDYSTSIDTSGFMVLKGCTAEINWERIDEFADEVAARAIREYVNGEDAEPADEPETAEAQ